MLKYCFFTLFTLPTTVGQMRKLYPLTFCKYCVSIIKNFLKGPFESVKYPQQWCAINSLRNSQLCLKNIKQKLCISLVPQLTAFLLKIKFYSISSNNVQNQFFFSANKEVMLRSDSTHHSPLKALKTFLLTFLI